MTEYPSNKPDQVILFATNETNNSEPSSGIKLDGYANSALLPSAQYNWMMWALSHVLDWTRALTVRHFDNLYDALFDADDTQRDQHGVFFLRGDVHRMRSGTYVQQAGAGTGIIRCICTDGGRLYYVQGGVFHSAKNIHSTSANGLASNTPAGGLNARTMHTDGRVCIVGNTNTLAPPVTVFDLSDPLNLPEIYEDAGSGSVDAVCADSRPGQVRVWWGTVAGGSAAKVHFWGPTDGKVDSVTGLEPVRALCASHEHLFVGTGDGVDAQVKIYEKSLVDDYALTFIANVDSSTALGASVPQARAQALCTDGDLVFWIADGDGSSQPITGAFMADGTEVWYRIHPANIGYGIGLGICCDDRYVYVPWYSGGSHGIMALDKRTGQRMGTLLHGTDMMTPCTDGVDVMTASATTSEGIFRTGTGRQPGLWSIQSGTEEGRKPFRNLAIPLGSGLR